MNGDVLHDATSQGTVLKTVWCTMSVGERINTPPMLAGQQGPWVTFEIREQQVQKARTNNRRWTKQHSLLQERERERERYLGLSVECWLLRVWHKLLLLYLSVQSNRILSNLANLANLIQSNETKLISSYLTFWSLSFDEWTAHPQTFSKRPVGEHNKQLNGTMTQKTSTK